MGIRLQHINNHHQLTHSLTRIKILLVGQVQEQRDQSRFGMTAHAPVVVRVVLLAVLVVHDLQVLCVLPGDQQSVVDGQYISWGWAEGRERGGVLVL